VKKSKNAEFYFFVVLRIFNRPYRFIYKMSSTRGRDMRSKDNAVIEQIDIGQAFGKLDR